MKKIILATVALSAIALLLFAGKRKKSPSAQMLATRRRGNKEKHLTNVFSKAKQELVQPAS